MKKSLKYIALASLITASSSAMAGGPERAGQAGATQLLINSWGRSSGWGNSNVAGVQGLESFNLNIGGLAKVNGTELIFARTNYLVGTGININTFGFAQNIGKDGTPGDNVIGITVTSFNIGQIPITTVEQPDGGLGTYKPQITNIGLGYARKFTKNISGGTVFRIINEATPDVRAMGVCLDAGVQYGTQFRPSSKVARLKENDIRFGISVRNIGPDMRFTGDGLATKSNIGGNSYTTTTSQRADKFNLPSLINIGGAYDFKLDKGTDVYYHRLTVAANFTNNSFSNNQTTIGLEYGYKNILMLRAGYAYEKGGLKYETRQNVYTGFSAGVTVEVPLAPKNKVTHERANNNTFAFDYSYRATNPFNGTHVFGIRVNID